MPRRRSEFGPTPTTPSPAVSPISVGVCSRLGGAPAVPCPGPKPVRQPPAPDQGRAGGSFERVVMTCILTTLSVLAVPVYHDLGALAYHAHRACDRRID